MFHPYRDFRSADPLRPPPETESRPFPESMSHPDLNTRSYTQNSHEYNMMHMDPRQRDILRQEAKMEEMREEVRRREDRERLLMQQQQQQQHLQMGRGSTWSLPRGPNPPVRPPHDYPTGHMHPPYAGGPPAPAPKPRQLYNNPQGMGLCLFVVLSLCAGMWFFCKLAGNLWIGVAKY